MDGVGEVHRKRREHLIPAVVARRAATAVRVRAGLLDRVAVETIKPDPEARVLRAVTWTRGSWLGPASRHAVERAVRAGDRVAGPVSRLRRRVTAVADHPGEAARPDHEAAGPERLVGEGVGGRCGGGASREGHRPERHAENGQGYEQATCHMEAPSGE